MIGIELSESARKSPVPMENGQGRESERETSYNRAKIISLVSRDSCFMIYNVVVTWLIRVTSSNPNNSIHTHSFCELLTDGHTVST